MATDYKLRITAQDKSKKGFNSVNKNINTTQQSMKKLAGAFAGVFAVRQLVQFGNQALQTADNIGKVADKLGVTTDFLQRMQFAAEQTGIAQNTLNMGLQRFIRRVAEARNGTGEAKAALEQLGIALNDADGNARSIEDVLADVSDGLANTADSGEQVRLAFKFFDSEGVSLVSTLGQGSDALKEMMKSATGVIPEGTIKRAEDFNDTMNRLRRQILAPLQTAFINTSNAILNFAESMGLIKPDLFSKSFDELNKAYAENTKNLLRLEIQLIRTSNAQAKYGIEVNVAKLKEENAELKKVVDLRKSQLDIEKKININASEIDTDPIKKYNDIVKDNITITKDFADTVDGQLTRAFTDFFDYTSEQFNDFKQLATSIARAVINELIQVFIVQKLVGMVKGGISDIGNLFKSAGETPDLTMGKLGGMGGLPNNEGGGFTGMGVRAGGIDGRGGFPAILHPNETVIDHTKGQGMGATVNFNISTVDAAGFDQLLASRKGLITSIINNAMNNQGKMGVV